MNHPQHQCPAPGPGARPVPPPQPLRHFDVGDTVTSAHGRDLVVLSPACTPPPASQDTADHHGGSGAGADWMHVYAGETGVTTAGADDLVVPLHATLRQVQLLRDAVADLSYHHEQFLTADREWRIRRQAQLLQIRRALIGHHLAGYLTVEGLGHLLADAGLAHYRPRLRVRFTITGSYDVEHSPHDLPEAISAARAQARQLLVDFTGVDDLRPGSPDLTVRVEDVSPADL